LIQIAESKRDLENARKEKEQMQARLEYIEKLEPVSGSRIEAVVIGIENFKKTVLERDETIVKRDEAIVKRDKEIEEFKKTIAKRDEEFKKTIAKRDEEFKKTIAKRDKEIEEFKKTIAKRDKENDEFKSALSKRDKDMAELTNRMFLFSAPVRATKIRVLLEKFAGKLRQEFQLEDEEKQANDNDGVFLALLLKQKSVPDEIKSLIKFSLDKYPAISEKIIHSAEEKDIAFHILSVQESGDRQILSEMFLFVYEIAAESFSFD
jgi:chromosome segregation ATPase